MSTRAGKVSSANIIDNLCFSCLWNPVYEACFEFVFKNPCMTNWQIDRSAQERVLLLLQHVRDVSKKLLHDKLLAILEVIFSRFLGSSEDKIVAKCLLWVSTRARKVSRPNVNDYLCFSCFINPVKEACFEYVFQNPCMTNWRNDRSALERVLLLLFLLLLRMRGMYLSLSCFTNTIALQYSIALIRYWCFLFVIFIHIFMWC